MEPVPTLLNEDPGHSPAPSWSPSAQPLDRDLYNLLLLASQIAQMPVAAVIQFKGGPVFSAILGLNYKEIPWAPPGDGTFDGKIIQVKDTLRNKQFRDHPLVSGESHIRFYAAIPLWADNGNCLGQLCVMDRRRGTLADTQLTPLQTLAASIARLLSLRSQQPRVGPDGQPIVRNGELMETIFNEAIDAVIVTDTSGVILKWNAMAEEIFGWRAIEVIARSFYNLVIPPRYHTEVTSLVRQQPDDSQKHTSDRSIEIRGSRKDLTEFDMTLTVSSTTIRETGFYVFFVNDITERKLAAEKLDKQKDFYEGILNKLPTDVAVFDAEHRYLFVNPAAISKEEYRKFIIGKDDYEYVQYRNRPIEVAHQRRAKFLEAKNGGKEVRWEDSLPDPNGNIITHLRRMYPVYDESGRLSQVIGFGIDITERKIMEEKQAAYVRQLSAQNTQLIDFCSIVSHNLRAPLVNISMLVDFIESDEDPEEQKLMISKLRPVIDNLHATFNELVESIQIRQDLEIQSEKVCLNDCIKRTLDGLQTEIIRLNAHFEIDFNEVSIINYPPKYINSIIHNLVSNSLKYHFPGRAPVISLKTKKVEDKVILSVRDNGLGVDLVKHKDSFFKIGKVFHRHPNAKGFGLFMTKTQVEAMGGRIWVESEPDKGTVFFIEFANQKRQAS